MKRLSVILLSAVFALALHSCGGGDDPVYEEYLEYPGDLAVLGFRGPVKSIWITSSSVAKGLDGSYRFYLSETAELYFDTDGNLTSKIVTGFEYIKESDTTEENERRIYDYVERDHMGRVTQETIANIMGSPFATVSYVYDDGNRKCRIKYIEEGKKKKTGSARLDGYGFYGSLFSTGCECLARLGNAKEDKDQQPYVYDYDETDNLEGLGYFPETATTRYSLYFTYEYY